jgi:hypothetical protein
MQEHAPENTTLLAIITVPGSLPRVKYSFAAPSRAAGPPLSGSLVTTLR